MPTSYGFQGLDSLDFSLNRMSGNISLEFDVLLGLKNFVLSFKVLSCFIPIHLGKSKVLEKLELSRNSFTGSMPEEILTCQNLILIDLSDNHISLSGGISQLDQAEIGKQFTQWRDFFFCVCGSRELDVYDARKQ